jgi:DNA-binding transcriptional ArsR family regulator
LDDQDSSEDYELFEDENEEDEELSYADAFDLGMTLELPEKDYERAGFSQDPFDRNIMPKGNRHLRKVPEFWELAKNIGTFVKKDPNPGLIVFGPSGLGKSLFAQTFAADLKSECLYIDLNKFRIVAETDASRPKRAAVPDQKKTLDIAKLGPVLASSEAKLVLLDHIDVESDWLTLSEPLDEWLPLASESTSSPKKVVLFLSHFEYEYSIKLFSGTVTFLGSTNFPVYPIPTLREKVIFQILQKRTQASTSKKNHPFSKKILKSIARQSLGLPLYALQIARTILSEFARITSPGDISYDDIVATILQTSDYARGYNLFTTLSEPKMTETRHKILQEIAFKSLSRTTHTEIAYVERKVLEGALVGEGAGKISNSTLTHHTRKLAQSNLVFARRSGTHMAYRLVPPIFHALEIFLHQKVWK